MAVGWSPLGSYSDTSLKAMPPSLFSGRGGRCGVNGGCSPDTSGCVAIIGCSASTCARPLGALVRLGQDGVEGSRHALDTARGRAACAGRGGWRARRAGTAPAAPRRSPAAAERLVSGVPPARSTGGAGGLPDLPREGRGRGWCRRARRGGFGGAGHGGEYGVPGACAQAVYAADFPAIPSVRDLNFMSLVCL